MLRLPRTPILLAILTSIALAESVPGEEPTSPAPAILIGRPVSETVAILRDRQIRWSEGGFQETRLNDDVADIAFALDKETIARVFYSKTTKKVAGVSIKIYPAQGASKITQTDLPAKSIRLENDGSYIVHFLPPNRGE